MSRYWRRAGVGMAGPALPEWRGDAGQLYHGGWQGQDAKMQPDGRNVGGCALSLQWNQSEDDMFLRDMLVCDIDMFRHPVVQSGVQAQVRRA